MRNSCTKKHRYIQGIIEQVAEDMTPHAWLVSTEKEYRQDPNFIPDVYVCWKKLGGRLHGTYDVYVEVQKDMGNKKYLDKRKTLIKRDTIVPSFRFVEIIEDKISDNWEEAYEQIRDKLVQAVPW